MWRRPVGRAASGPGRRIQTSDFDPQDLPGCKIVDGRLLSQVFIDEMVDARMCAPPDVDFVQQMRERKLNGASQGPSSTDWPQEPPYKYFSSAEGSEASDQLM